MSGIIVGVDGSGDSQRALEWAMNEAAVRRAPLTVIAVAQPVVGYWGLAYYQEYQALVEQAQLVAEEAVEKARAYIDDASPASVTIQAVNGIVAEEMLNAARNADMIVVGCHGTGRHSGRRLLGSVSTQIMYRARCPVVVTPPEDRGWPCASTAFESGNEPVRGLGGPRRKAGQPEPHVGQAQAASPGTSGPRGPDLCR